MVELRYDNTLIYALSLIRGIGAVSIANLVNNNFYYTRLKHSSERELSRHIKGGHSKYAIQDIINKMDEYIDKAKSEIAKFAAFGIDYTTFWDKNYPIRLRTLDKPPVFLFSKGNIELLNHFKTIGINCPSDCSEKGRQITERTTKFFISKDYNIVTLYDLYGFEEVYQDSSKFTTILSDINHYDPYEDSTFSRRYTSENTLSLSVNKPYSYKATHEISNNFIIQAAISQAIFMIEMDKYSDSMKSAYYAHKLNKRIYCPDICRISDYTSKRNSGIRKLICKNWAILYTKKDYLQIYETLMKEQLHHKYAFRRKKVEISENINQNEDYDSELSLPF